MAVAALVCALMAGPVGIVLGHIARRQIKQSGESGWTLTTAALVIGYVSTGLALAVVLIAVLVIVFAANRTYEPEPISAPVFTHVVTSSVPIGLN
jgi:hypothetical protein